MLASQLLILRHCFVEFSSLTLVIHGLEVADDVLVGNLRHLGWRSIELPLGLVRGPWLRRGPAGCTRSIEVNVLLWGVEMRMARFLAFQGLRMLLVAGGTTFSELRLRLLGHWCLCHLEEVQSEVERCPPCRSRCLLVDFMRASWLLSKCQRCVLFNRLAVSLLFLFDFWAQILLIIIMIYRFPPTIQVGAFLLKLRAHPHWCVVNLGCFLDAVVHESVLGLHSLRLVVPVWKHVVGVVLRRETFISFAVKVHIFVPERFVWALRHIAWWLVCVDAAIRKQLLLYIEGSPICHDLHLSNLVLRYVRVTFPSLVLSRVLIFKLQVLIEHVTIRYIDYTWLFTERELWIHVVSRSFDFLLHVRRHCLRDCFVFHVLCLTLEGLLPLWKEVAMDLMGKLIDDLLWWWYFRFNNSSLIYWFFSKLVGFWIN